MSWTGQRVADLKRLNAENLSASQIASELGGVTRNAVIGKLHRIGVAKTRPVLAVPRVRRPRVARAIQRIVGNRARESLDLVPEPEPIEDIDIPLDQRRSLMQLTERTCRWPVGDPQQPTFFFCGGPVEHDASPYCACHARLAGAGYGRPSRRNLYSTGLHRGGIETRRRMKHRRRYRSDGLRVSDHALLRFLERAGGFEVEALRSAIEDSLIRATAKAAEIGAADFEVRADGLRYLVRNNVVVTVLDDAMPTDASVVVGAD